MKQKNIITMFILALAMCCYNNSVSAMPEFADNLGEEPQQTHFNPFFPYFGNFNRPSINKSSLESALRNNLSDFEEAWNFIKSQCRTIDSSYKEFMSRLWKKPLTECCRYALNIFWLFSIISSITGIGLMTILLSYVGPKVVYKYFTLLYEFASFMDRFFGAQSAVAQCYIQSIDGLMMLPCTELPNFYKNPSVFSRMTHFFGF